MSSNAKIFEDFNKFLDRATNPMLLEPDAIAVAEVCRMVDDFLVEADDAIQAIHGKILDENPHTVNYALTVLNNVFYKCGNIAHSVIVTPQYMELIKDIVQTTEHKKIKEKIITMLEDWADKFKYLPNYCAVQVLLDELNGRSSKKNYKNLKTEKFQHNNGKNSSKKCQKSAGNKGKIKVNNDCIKIDLNNNRQEERIFTEGIEKVKSRRQLLEHSLDEYRVSKKEEYYKKSSKNCSDAAVDWEDEYIPVKFKSESKKKNVQKELQTALLLSQEENGFLVDVDDKSLNVCKENNLGEARAICNSQSMEFANDEGNLQIASNLSIIEAQEQNLSSMPKFDENVDDLHVCLAKQLSLDELANSEKLSECHRCKKVENLCLICYEIKLLRTFVPCNHSCICHECTLGYRSNTCPLCQKEYIAILFPTK